MTTTSQATGVAIATNAEDAGAIAAVERHHTELSGHLSVLVGALLEAASGPDEEAVDAARGRLLEFISRELLPHAAAEEVSLYPAAAADPGARLLIDGMLAEHRALERLVTEVTNATEPVRAAAAARSLQVLFEVHLDKENDLVLPVIAADPGTSLASVLAGMHEILGHDDEQSGADGCGGNCGCGEAADEASTPVLDVRAVPHAIRHATVLGAVDAIPVAGAIVLVAPHDPIPLLAQIQSRTNGAFSVDYEQRGPDVWRLRLNRQR